MPELGPIAPKVTESSFALRDTPAGDLEFDRHLGAGSPAPAGEERLPALLVFEHIITKLGKRDFLNARLVSTAWKAEIDRQRGATLQFLSEIRRVTNGQDPQPAWVALGLLGAIRDNLDDLTRTERTEIASFVKNLTDEDFVDALSYLGPGVQHFSLAQQDAFLDRAEQLWRRRDTSLHDRDWSNAEKAQIGTLRLVPHLSEGPRRRAFDFFLAQVAPVARKVALEVVADQSDRMSTGELDAAVDIVVNPHDAFHRADEEDWARAVAALGCARDLTGQQRDRLLATAQGFAGDDNDEHFSLACAGILDGASLSLADWPGPQRLEALVDRA
jgi:hypothetical protein